VTGPSVTSLRADLRAARVTPADVVERVLARIADFGDPAVLISSFTPDELVARAKAAHPGALQGIPFMVKDNIDVAGLPTTAGCPAFAYTPKRSATVVERLEAAGAIVIGKTNLDQFATGLVGTRSPYGTPRNVRDAKRVPGGSSSGSAVAVAAGMVPFALGTDTAGSGRVPAALNGIVGAKPTCGWLSTRGVVPAVQSIDCVSVLAGSTEDAGMVLDLAAGFDGWDPFSRRPVPQAPRSGPLRIGIGGPLPSGIGDALDAIGPVVDVDASACLRAGGLLYGGPFVAERYAAVGSFIAAHPDDVDPVVREIILGGSRWSAADLAAARYELARLCRAVEAIWQDVDVLVLPTVDSHPTLAEVATDPVGVNSVLGRFTSGTNLCDLCAVAVPGPGAELGVQILGPAWSDRRVAEVAGRLERAAGPMVSLAVVGAHLRGQPLHHQLTELGARLEQVTETSPEYRLYALRGTVPPKPGLVRVGTGGAPIAVEVYRLSEAAFGHFVAAVPAPLCIGTVRLAGGDAVSGFLCEPLAVERADDITRFGGWGAYLACS